MSKQTSNSALENPHEDRHFRVRLMARLLVVFICVTLAGQRLAIAYGDHNGIVTATSIMITLPLLFALALIVIIKYVLYRKIGVRAFKYAKLLDIAFSLIFTAEWLLTLNAQLNRPVDKQDYSYSLISVVGFVSFAWRTLLQILISQHWQVKIIPPIAAYTYLLVFAVRHQSGQTFFILLSGLLQILYIILIFYFEHKINFTLLLGNMQQQQWLKLNEFILNNVPENIAIMDLNGNCSFINENFKKLISQRTSSDETKQFFTCIKDIKQLQQENENDSGSVIIEIPLLERCISSESKGNIHDETKSEAHANTFSLTELINFFGKLVSKGFVKEKSFYLFNGKFNCEENPEERSFEINLSFFNHLPDKYILLILRDTTQRDQLLALEGNIKYKDHLLASVSHELRTPLNGNINLLEAAIESNDVTSKIKENLLMPAVKSSKFLLYLINDILDMSQIKCQKLRLVFQQLSLKETLMNALQLLEHYAQKKHLKIHIDMDPNLPFTFCTDHARLSQIILNLVNNSIKFTQKGHIKLSAWPLRDTDQIVVSVEDPGIGMTKEDMSKIFQEFTKIGGKDLEKLNPRGVGLGLKIANDLAEMLGPKGNKGIKVDSSINEGSVFSFVLENKETGLRSQETQEIKDVDGSLLVPDEFPGDTESSLEVKVSRLKSMSLTRCTRTDIPSITTLTLCSCAKVLVVDDDPFNIMAYEVILSSLRVKYECVYSGRSAIDKMLNKVRYPCSGNCSPYKIVFMDEEMPGMTGKETVREIIRLQEKNLLPEMKIIGCTAHHDGEEIEQFVKCGITEYVPKPISMNGIKRILDKYEA